MEEVRKGLCPTSHEDGSCGAVPQEFGCALKSPQGHFLWWELGNGNEDVLKKKNEHKSKIPVRNQSLQESQILLRIWVNSGNHLKPWSSCVVTAPQLCLVCSGFKLFGCFSFCIWVLAFRFLRPKQTCVYPKYKGWKWSRNLKSLTKGRELEGSLPVFPPVLMHPQQHKFLKQKN